MPQQGEFFQKAFLFKESQSHELWMDISHLRYSFDLFRQNYFELKKQIQKHDYLAMNQAFWSNSNRENRSRLQKKVSFLLFNFLSAGYALREYRENKSNSPAFTPGSEFFSQISKRKDPYSSNSLLRFARSFRNFLVHKVDPASFISSRFEAKNAAGNFEHKAYIGFPKCELNKYDQMRTLPAKDYLKNAGKYVNVSEFVELYFAAEKNESKSFLLEFLRFQRQEFTKMISEMRELMELCKEKEIDVQNIPFRLGALRYSEFLLKKL